MRVLVTGADGFVGRSLCAALAGAGHDVLEAVRTGEYLKRKQEGGQADQEHLVPLELEDDGMIASAVDRGPDAIVHLAAVASGAAARRDPGQAWRINALGTVALMSALERAKSSSRFLLASSGEVYGRGLTRPAREDDPVLPCSPYAASKAAAEIAVLEAHRRCGADVVVARAFAQTGPGQSTEFVAPAFAGNILAARKAGSHTVRVGNLSPIREFLDVRDVARALVLLLERAEGGSVYNISRGQAVALGDLLARLSKIIDWPVTPEVDQARLRSGDVPYLVGDGARLGGLGWSATYDLDTTLRDLVHDLSGSQSGGVRGGQNG